MKVAVLYICTGNYVIFWKNFFKRTEQYFLPGVHKEYFVFTDADSLYAGENARVHKVCQQQLGWPYDTLMRFQMFLGVEEELKNFDFLFFLNANMQFVDFVKEEVLPTASEGLLAVQHPGFYNKTAMEFTLETNPASTAYVNPVGTKHYFMGGFNGGRANDYLALARDIHGNILADLKNDIIAVWHDESHLNKYLADKNPKILDPSYGFVNSWALPFVPKIVVLDKDKFGGYARLRYGRQNKDAALLDKIKALINRARLKLGVMHSLVCYIIFCNSYTFL